MRTLSQKILKLSGIISMLLLPGAILVGQETNADKKSGRLEENTVVQLDPFVLTGKTERGYGARESIGGSRISLPLLDTPMSIVVINKELMNDVGAQNSFDALRWVSGLGPNSNVTNGSYTLRGLPTDTHFDPLDGLPAGGEEQETEFIERWEVVKGAAGTLYGEHTLGGLINRVYKRPLSEQQTIIRSFVDDVGPQPTFQASVDNTGPIDREKQLTYRVVGVYRNGETQNGGADDKNAFYLTLNYTPKDGRTSFWGRAERRYILTGHETGGAFVDGAGKSSLDYFGFGTRTSPLVNNAEHLFKYYEFGLSTGTSGRLGEWNVRFVTRYIDDLRVGRTPATIPLGFAFLDSNGVSLGATTTAVIPATQPTFAGSPWKDIRLANSVSRIDGPIRDEIRGYFLDLTGSFETGPLSHRLIAYMQETATRQRFYTTSLTLRPEFGGPGPGGVVNLANAYSLVNPVSLPQDFTAFIRPPGPTQSTRTSGDKFNVGIQDNIYLWDHRILLVGGMRYDYVQNNGTYNYITRTAGAAQTSTNVVSKASLVVKPFSNQGVSMFVNYAETFSVRFGELIVGSGIPFKNLEGVTKEVGIKLDLLGNQLVATAAYFDSELQNNVIFSFNPATGFQEFFQGGVSTFKGWDMDLAWNITNNWTALAGVSDVNARNFNGNLLRGVMNSPNYKVLLRYTASKGALEGLSAGGGVVYLSDRAGSAAADFTVPGYANYEAFVAYSRRNWRLQLNAYNLTNAKGLNGPIFGALIIPTDPRHFRLSAQYSF